MIINKGRILLVDDEPLVLEIIEAALSKEGYEVTSAPDSQSALHLIERCSFDGIVCDVRLENLDGFDLLTVSRKRNPNLAAVLITGAPSDDDANRAKQMKAAYLSKPIALGHLFASLSRSLHMAKLDGDEQPLA